MKDFKNEYTMCRKVREEVPEGSTVERIFNCPQSDINVVLKDWQKVKANYKKIGVDVFQYLLVEHPFYKSLFPSFASVSYDDLEKNEDFLIHAYAVIKGLTLLMNNLSGKYEEDDEILSIISYTHYKRGITREMMTHLREALLFVCGTFLESTINEKASWKTVLKYIFDDYLFKYLPADEEEEELF